MFGTSGIRGPVGSDVTASLALDVGRAVASEGAARVVVGRDPRDSGSLLADAVSAGLRECGADVDRVGVAATPTVARAVRQSDADAGVVVTASHNPPEDNGLKLWTASGRAYDADDAERVARRVRNDRFALADWKAVGAETHRQGAERRHRDALVADGRRLDGLDVVVDVGNGAGGVTADALADLGASVSTLHAQRDGRFPGRPSEPTAENCAGLAAHVDATDADLGVAHDGDADRTMAVDDEGRFVPGDVLLAVFARAAASDGDRVAVPIDTSLAVDSALSEVGADAVRTPVGDVHVAQRVADDDLPFGGEPSGAWLWRDAVPWPDGPLAAVRLAGLVAERGPLSALVDGVDTFPLERDAVETERKDAVMEVVANRVRRDYENVASIDGVRATVDDGWFLVRASGTEPLVRVTAEARSAGRARELRATARELVTTARSETA